MYKNYHVLEAKYYPATNISGSRIGIKSKRFNKRVIIDYDHNFNGTLDIAENYLDKNGFNIIGHAEFGDSYLIITDTFDNGHKLTTP